MRLWKTTLCLAIFLQILSISQTTNALGNESNSESWVKKTGVKEYKLSNGLRALFIPDSKASQTAVTFVYLSGSLDDPIGKSGLAHMLEHLMFSGPEQDSSNSLIKQMAFRNISFNGNTGFERTIYQATFKPSQDNLSWVLEQEAFRMRNASITEKELKKELAIVLREKEIEEGNLEKTFIQDMFQKVSGFADYARKTIGTEAELNTINVDDVLMFKKKHYQAENAFVIITGNFDSEATLSHLKKTFNTEALNSDPNKHTKKYTSGTSASDPTLPNNIVKTGPTALLVSMYQLPKDIDAQGLASLHLLGHLLTGHFSSSSQSKARPSAYSVNLHASPTVLRNGSVFQIHTSENRQSIRSQLLSELKNIRNITFDTQEFDLAKKKMNDIAEQIISQPAIFGFVLADNAAFGNWELFFQTLAESQSINLKEFNRNKDKLLASAPTFGDMVVSSAEPNQTASKVNDFSALFATKPSSNATINTQQLDKETGHDTLKNDLDNSVKEFSIDNDFKVSLLSKGTTKNRVYGLLNLRMGSVESLKGKRVLSDVTGSMLSYGTTNIAKAQLSENIAKLQTNLFIIPSDDRLIVRFDTPPESLENFLELLSNILRNPALSESAFTDVVYRMRENYNFLAAQPEHVANELLTEATSPYAIDDIRRNPGVQESLRNLNKISLNQAKEFYNDFYGANGELVLIGNLDTGVLQPKLFSLFGNWKSKVAYSRPDTLIGNPISHKLHKKIPNKSFGVYRAKLPLNLNGDKDAIALKLVNSIFGDGSLNSKLVSRLREREGISYNSNSNVTYSNFSSSGFLAINATYQPKSSQVLSKAIHEELALLAQGGITEGELQYAKTKWKDSSDESLRSEKILTDRVSLNMRLKRDMGYYTAENQYVEEVSLSEINAAIKRSIDPNKLVEVFVDSEQAEELKTEN